MHKSTDVCEERGTTPIVPFYHMVRMWGEGAVSQRIGKPMDEYLWSLKSLYFISNVECEKRREIVYFNICSAPTIYPINFIYIIISSKYP